jgi:hypothetical protein
MNTERKTTEETDANHDPISGQPGAHPVATGIGAAGVGTAATVVGAVVGGPVGAAVGAVVGAVVGGLAGKKVGEKINPTVEDAYWRENYSTRTYVQAGKLYEEYQPAYRIGYEGYDRYADTGRSYDEVESELKRDYESQSASSLDWETAKYAVRDGWDRAARSITQP